MKKRILVLMMLMCTILMLSGCCLSHEWADATCTTPRTCSKCGEIEGEALPHTLTEANYQEPATCTICGSTEGDVLEPYEIGVAEGVKIGEVYDFVTSCNTNEKETTVAKVEIKNY